MKTRFCKDCANFEDRRDLDDMALCTKNHGPYVCCEDLELKDDTLNENRLYHRFCSECINFQDEVEIPLCAKNHVPGVACADYIERSEKLNVLIQNNLMKTALLINTINIPFNPHLPDHIIESAKKIKW